MIVIKVAIVSPLNFATKSSSIGSVESLTGNLVKQLATYPDIEVTLFASGDSEQVTNLVPIIKKGFGGYCHKQFEKAMEKQVNLVKARASEFDIIHSHLSVGDTAKMMAGHRTPVVKTLHGAIIKQGNERETQARMAAAAKLSFLIPVSNYLHYKSDLFRYTDTVYNGIPMENFKFIPEPQGDQKGEYWAFMGRLNPVKGVHYAIQVALHYGKRLKIAGMKSSKSEEKYFEEWIQPYLGKQIEYMGVVREQKADFLGNARLLLAPSCCEEAFGLVNIEALACGTPVLASKRGALPEIIAQGKTGYLATGKEFTVNLQELIAYAPLAEKLDRKMCRNSVLKKFTVEKMVANYVKVYHQILAKNI